MRKPLLSAILFLYALFAVKAIAQNIERENVQIQFIRLPLKKLPDTTETYYVNVLAKNTSHGNTLGKYYSDRVLLNGYYRLQSNEDADIIITAELNRDLSYDAVTLQSETYTYKKNKNTPEISYKAYWYTVSYTTPQIFYRIESGNGSKIEEGTVGGVSKNKTFGSTSYENHYSSEYQVAAAWRDVKNYKLAEWEREHYDEHFANVPYNVSAWCLNNWRNAFSVKYVKEKKTNDYEDLREAKNLFGDGVRYINNDSIYLINKLYQPDYESRKETIGKAIAIWEKALEEADFKDKKARIDQRVGRHLYFNLALAYLLIDNFDKAQQYLQGREDEETKNIFLKNTFAGMKSLSAFIDDQKKRYEANKWRPLLTGNLETYVYKDPATRQKEKDEAIKEQVARQKVVDDSIKIASKKVTGKKPPAKSPVKKTASPKKITAGTSTAKQK